MISNDFFSVFDFVVYETRVDFSKTSIYDKSEDEKLAYPHHIELNDNLFMSVNSSSFYYFDSLDKDEYIKHNDLIDLTSSHDNELVYDDHVVLQEDYTLDLMVVNLLNSIIHC